MPTSFPLIPPSSNPFVTCKIKKIEINAKRHVAFPTPISQLSFFFFKEKSSNLINDKKYKRHIKAKIAPLLIC